MDRVPHHTAESPAPAPRQGTYASLNELHIMERAEFVQMAPAVVQLEVTRLTGMMAGLEAGSEAHTAVVAARHRLRAFQEKLEETARSGGDLPTSESLDAAIVCLAVDPSRTEAATLDSLVYVADRLGYISKQMRRLR